jgi:1-deoxy-D-xylulose-5-phosphate synthase
VLPDLFLDHGKPEAMYESAGLNASGIVNAVVSALGASAAANRDSRA